MKLKNWNAALVALSCVGMLVPQVAFAAPAGIVPSDIALHQNGVVVGQIVDAQGGAVAMAPVTISSAGKEIARTQSDSMGKFSISGLNGGVYQLAAAGHQGVYRMWAPRTAPPAAQQGLLVVSQSDVVRGQNPLQGVASWVAQHPIITAGIVGAAIAIPIAIDDDDDSPATP